MEIGLSDAVTLPLNYQLGILDASSIANVREIFEAVRQRLQMDGHADYAPSKCYSTQELHDRLDKGNMLGVTQDQKPVGFVYLGETSIQNPQDGVPGMRVFYDPKNTAVLRNAMVHPLHQGHGLGRKLFQACVDLAKKRGYKEIVSGVTAPNVASWHNLVHAGLKLVQIGLLPPEISPDSESFAFYFHRHFQMESRPKDTWRRTVDPLQETRTSQALLENGWTQAGYEKQDGNMRLIFAHEIV